MHRYKWLTKQNTCHVLILRYMRIVFGPVYFGMQLAIYRTKTGNRPEKIALMQKSKNQ